MVSAYYVLISKGSVQNLKEASLRKLSPTEERSLHFHLEKWS